MLPNRFTKSMQRGVKPLLILVEERGLTQISDPDILFPIIDEIISKNPQNVEKYKKWTQKTFGLLRGARF